MHLMFLNNIVKLPASSFKTIVKIFMRNKFKLHINVLNAKIKHKIYIIENNIFILPKVIVKLCNSPSLFKIISIICFVLFN